MQSLLTPMPVEGFFNRHALRDILQNLFVRWNCQRMTPEEKSPETNLGTISMTRTASDRGRHAIPSASPIMISPGRTQISWSTKLRRTGTSTALKSHFSVALLAKDLVVTWADIPLPHLLWRLLGRKSENPVSRK